MKKNLKNIKQFVVFKICNIRWKLELKVQFFFQAEDGIRDSVASRGLGDVYKRQEC